MGNFRPGVEELGSCFFAGARRFSLVLLILSMSFAPAFGFESSYGLKDPIKVQEIDMMLDDIIIGNSIGSTRKQGTSPGSIPIRREVRQLIEAHEKIHNSYNENPSETLKVIDRLLVYLGLQ